MRHYNIGGGYNRHYAVDYNGMGGVLLQLGEDVESEHCQVRVCLTVKEADHMIGLLQKARLKAVECEEQKQAESRTSEAMDVSCVPGNEGKMCKGNKHDWQPSGMFLVRMVDAVVAGAWVNGINLAGGSRGGINRETPEVEFCSHCGILRIPADKIPTRIVPPDVT